MRRRHRGQKQWPTLVLLLRTLLLVSCLWCSLLAEQDFRQQQDVAADGGEQDQQVHHELPHRQDGRLLNVALHAQVSPSAGFIVGSVLTTDGMRSALLASGHVAHAQVFYPFHYEGLHDRPWDIVIIEGYFRMINAFIHEVRRASSGRAKVFFYCLDPALPGLPATAALDVDGFFTNSLQTLQTLQVAAPTAYLPLAVDTAAFALRPEPPPPSPPPRVVYVGAGGALAVKRDLRWMLLEAAPYGLDIYGSDWRPDTVGPDLAAHWRGVAPAGALPALYGASLAVLGATMDAQRDVAMLNNRVFEALATGAPLIHDDAPGLAALFPPPLATVARTPGDVASALDALLAEPREEGHWRRAARRAAAAAHSWDARISAMFAVAERTPPADAPDACARRACPRALLVVDPRLRYDAVLLSTLGEAAARLGAGAYRVRWAHEVPAGADTACVRSYDTV